MASFEAGRPSLAGGFSLQERPLLRIATAGSVDDGKSTLIGRLLLDAKLILSDQLAALQRTGSNGRPDLASITDGLRAEREQGITIDVAYRYFATGRRTFIIADTPGHERYTRNMVTGASTAELAIVLIDARNGIVEQSRRHAYLSSLLGIRHLVAAVNKMDLVDWDEGRFREIERGFLGLAARLGVEDPLAIPISALEGDNVVDRGASSSWYDGPPLLEHLEEVDVAEERHDGPFRMPVQWVIRPRERGRDAERRYAGQIAGGGVSPGDEVVVLPAGVRTTVSAVETSDARLESASRPMSISVRLSDDLDVGRGDVLAAPGAAPSVGRAIEATICWMAQAPMRPHNRYALKAGTRTTRAVVESIEGRVDLHRLEERPGGHELGLNDIGRVRLRTSAPIVADAYSVNRATGAFILIDEHDNDTVGAGMIIAVGDQSPAAAPRSPDVTWHEPDLDRARRAASLGHSGATIWLTGLPASGKSTVASLLEARLVASGRPAYLLDGDNVRHGLSGDLGFSAADRAENIRRVAHVACLMADSGTVAIVSLVSPASADRLTARRLHEAAELPFLEVWVDTPVEVCEARDPKGLYARARAGALQGLTGVDAPYDVPENPEFVIDGADETPAAAAEKLAAIVAEL